MKDISSTRGSSPKSVKEQLQESARDLWSSVLALERKGPASVSPETPTNDQQEGQQNMSLESVIRVIFTSCTTGPPGMDEELKRRDDQPTEPTTPERKGSFYRSLFQDSHLRAEEAVHHLREQLERRGADKSPQRPFRGKDVPAMFPASSPRHHRSIEVPVLPTGLPTSISESDSDNFLKSITFDDGVSAITQHTLEEQANLFYSGEIPWVRSDVTQDPVEQVEESWKQTVRPSVTQSPSPTQRAPKASPIHRSSNRSHCTTHTKRSNGTKSMGTRSTLSTQTNEFASVFRKEEQKYWDEVVREQDDDKFHAISADVVTRHRQLMKTRDTRRMRKSREDQSCDSYTKRDGTITTVHSTVYSSSRRNSYDDPDRIADVLVLSPSTEVGEI